MKNLTSEEKFTKMTTERVGHLVTEMALPSIVIMMISGLYNLVDTFFIGRLNTQSVAALGIVFTYMGLIQAVSFYFGQGSGNFVSRALGRKETAEAEKIASTGFFSCILTGCVFTVAGLCFTDSLLRFFGSTPTILPYARSYFRWILLGSPFIMGGFALNNLMRLQGNALLAMVGIASGAIVNIALDPLFIFVFGMGISGAGAATFISQALSFFILLGMSGRNGGVRISPHLFKPTLNSYREINAGGLPSLARQGLMSISIICLNVCAAKWGDEAVAAFSVVSRVSFLSGAAMIGYGHGFQPVCGFNYGAGKFDRVRSAFFHCLLVSSIYCLILAVLGFVFAPNIVRFFRPDDPLVIDMGKDILRFQCLTFPLMGITVMANMYLQNIKKTVPATLVAMSRQGIFFIVILFIAMRGWGLRGLEATQPLSDVCTVLLAIPLTAHALRGMGKAGENSSTRPSEV